MQIVTLGWLKKQEVFKNVPDEQLQWLIDNSRHYELAQGDFLFEPGMEIKGTHILYEGKIRFYILQNKTKFAVTDFLPGQIAGYLPYSRAKISGGYGQAVEDVKLMTLPSERIREMIRDHYELTQTLVHVMSDRVRDFTALQQQNEKMMALGKLSAGLAHELNNPVSAIVRGSMSLRNHLQMAPETFKKVIAIRMDAEQVDAVKNDFFRILSAKKSEQLSLRERTVKEDEMTDWFEQQGIENEEDMAECFVGFGFTLSDLQSFNQHIAAEYLSPVYNWIHNNLVAERMVEDIQDSSQRIATLLGSIKMFTHMDRGHDKQYADIRTGIRNTLTMLGYKIKKGNIAVMEDYAEDIPEVKALIGELNQVWTNLIDNALDAMEVNKKGTLTIKTEKDHGFVKISIIDDGPGIPAEIQTRIFDPFFTTKDIGKGTGMGLEVVQRIVQQHQGSIKVKSIPGHTEFVVCFPING